VVRPAMGGIADREADSTAINGPNT
jgi:hypothetical protein